jgi:predicted  nucleic acid-binding Zn-ribbon protein
MNSSRDTMNKQRTIFIVTIIVLIGVIGFLLINNNQKTKQVEEQTVALEETEKLKSDLEKQYYEALSELESQRGTNEELNALIERQKEELKQQKNQIGQLLNSRADLNKARQQIADLKNNVDRYLAEIKDLKELNDILNSENQSLQTKTTQLSAEVEKEKTEKQELAIERSVLSNEKDKLEKNNSVLSKKVNKASVLNASNIVVTGLQVKSSGKERKKSRAGSVDRLKVCFAVAENNIADSGYERYYIRIVAPGGFTLGTESDGSGSFSSSDDNTSIRYTLIKEFDYNNNKQDICLNWDQDNDFQKGEYKIEIYNKGYLAGSSTFKLK